MDTTFAWIQDGNVPPETPVIDGPTRGRPDVSYDYNFVITDPDGSIIYCYVDWDDGSNTDWIGPYEAGEVVTLSHSWIDKDTYTIRCKAKDPYGAETDWSELIIEIPRNRESTYLWYQWFLEKFSMLSRLLNLIG
jgi:hypothetical protein